MKKPLILAGFIFLTSLHAQTGNTGINTTAPKATLDVNLPSNYTNGQLAGVTIPQLTGDQIEAMSAATPKVGTIVYATAISTAATKDVAAVGYWYWKDATDKWEPFTLGTSASGNTVDWSVNGNSGTTAANYLGTKDNQPLNFKTNATTDTNPKMTILQNGNVGIDNIAPAFKLDVNGNTKSAQFWSFSTKSNTIFHPVFISLSSFGGTWDAPVYVKQRSVLGAFVSRDAKSNAEAVGSTYGGSDIYARATEDFSNTNKGSDLTFSTTPNGSNQNVERLKIDHNGNVGISTTNPQAKLHIDGAADNPATGTPIAVQVANDVVVTNSGRVGIGTISPISKIDIVAGADVNPTFRIRGEGPGSYILTDLYSSQSLSDASWWWGRRARGSIDAPAFPLNGDFLLGIVGSDANGGISRNGGAAVYFKATENYEATKKGAQLEFATSANGTLDFPQTRMWISENGNVGINNPTPQAKLDIVAPTAGTGFKMADGTQSNGKVLTSDNNGNAQWAFPVMSNIVGVQPNGSVHYPASEIPVSNSGMIYTYKRTGFQITIPPGTYMIFVQGLVSLHPNFAFSITPNYTTPYSSSNELSAVGQTITIRMGFAESTADELPANSAGGLTGVIGNQIISTIAYGYAYQQVIGQVTLRNNTSTNKTLTLYGGATSGFNLDAPRVIYDFFGGRWAEESITAFRVGN